MKYFKFALITLFAFYISACNKIPSICEEVWTNTEKLAKESGIPQTAIDQQKKQFEEQIKQLSKEDAEKTCEIQNSIFS
jgi:starvation-inducible outer membrane lipoprotein